MKEPNVTTPSGCSADVAIPVASATGGKAGSVRADRRVASADKLGTLPPKMKPGFEPETSDWVDRLAQSESPAFTARRKRRQERSGARMDPIVWRAARGANVVDAHGNRYVDLTSGFGVASLGHAHPAIVHALREQSASLIHGLGDVHPSTVKIELLEALVKLAPWPARAALGLSGSDAVETALKTAALYTERPGVLAFEGSYHGLSSGPLAACGYQKAFRKPFAAQLNPHVEFAAYGEDPGPLGDTIGAILVEPMLGRGGVVVPGGDFLPALRQRADAAGAVLIIDEVFTGLWRTGAPLMSGDLADLLCLGKALGGGMPVSACVGRTEVMQAWGDPDGEAIHTGTFFGHPLSCAAALASLLALQSKCDGETLESRVKRLEARFRSRVEASGFVVRGRGLALGVEMPEGGSALPLVSTLLSRGYLTLAAGQRAEVLQVAPPLTIAEPLFDEFISELLACLATERQEGSTR